MFSDNVKTCKCLMIGTKMHGWMKQIGSMDSTNIKTLIYTVRSEYRIYIAKNRSRIFQDLEKYGLHGICITASFVFA